MLKVTTIKARKLSVPGIFGGIYSISFLQDIHLLNSVSFLLQLGWRIKLVGDSNWKPNGINCSLEEYGDNRKIFSYCNEFKSFLKDYLCQYDAHIWCSPPGLHKNGLFSFSVLISKAKTPKRLNYILAWKDLGPIDYYVSRSLQEGLSILFN